PAVLELARTQHVTRSAAAMSYLSPLVPGAVVAIGNAPTALAALLDSLGKGLSPPALIVGTPVGFVGAAEAKAKLMERDIPHVTVEGTRGGSAIAASVVNALLRLAAEKGGVAGQRPVVGNHKLRHRK
ncbi:MAG: precorrin-8X methylmutase, partial [Chloroflexota bacterium]